MGWERRTSTYCSSRTMMECKKDGDATSALSCMHALSLFPFLMVEGWAEGVALCFRAFTGLGSGVVLTSGENCMNRNNKISNSCREYNVYLQQYDFPSVSVTRNYSPPLVVTSCLGSKL